MTDCEPFQPWSSTVCAASQMEQLSGPPVPVKTGSCFQV